MERERKYMVWNNNNSILPKYVWINLDYNNNNKHKNENPF